MMTVFRYCLMLGACLLAACSSGGSDQPVPAQAQPTSPPAVRPGTPADGNTNNRSVVQGVFQSNSGAPIAGARFVAGEEQGVTDETGRFFYQEGQQVQFAVGALALGQAAAAETVTIADLFDAAGVENARSVGALVWFLEALDIDQNANNGILIPEDLRVLALDWAPVNFLAEDLAAELADILSDIIRIIPNVQPPANNQSLCEMAFSQTLIGAQSIPDIQLAVGLSDVFTELASLPVVDFIPGEFMVNRDGSVNLASSSYTQNVSLLLNNLISPVPSVLEVPLANANLMASCANDQLEITGQLNSFSQVIDVNVPFPGGNITTSNLTLTATQVNARYTLSLNEQSGQLELTPSVAEGPDVCEMAFDQTLNGAPLATLDIQALEIAAPLSGLFGGAINLSQLDDVPGSFSFASDGSVMIEAASYEQTIEFSFSGLAAAAPVVIDVPLTEANLAASCENNQLRIMGNLGAFVREPSVSLGISSIPLSLQFSPVPVDVSYNLSLDEATGRVVVDRPPSTAGLCDRLDGQMFSDSPVLLPVDTGLVLGDVVGGLFGSSINLPALQRMPGQFTVASNGAVDILANSYIQMASVETLTAAFSLPLDEGNLQAQCRDDQLTISGLLPSAQSSGVLNAFLLSIPITLEFNPRAINAVYRLSDDGSNGVILESVTE